MWILMIQTAMLRYSDLRTQSITDPFRRSEFGHIPNSLTLRWRLYF